MTTQKSFKRRVRRRMAKTGESYTSARAQLLPKSEPEPETPVQRATGRRIEEWFALLDAAGAAEMPHREIARLLRDEHGVPGWWAQNVTVEYERARGIRAVNQNGSGFYAGVSKTIRRPAAEVYAVIEAQLGEWKLRVRTARPGKGFRCDAAEGRPHIEITDKGDRCTVTVAHERLPDADAVARWKAVWRDRLAALAE